MDSKEILGTLIAGITLGLGALARLLLKKKRPAELEEGETEAHPDQLRAVYSELSLARAEIVRLSERINTCENALHAWERLYQKTETDRVEAVLRADRLRAENDTLRQRIEELKRAAEVEPSTGSGDITDKMQAVQRRDP